MTRVLAGTPVYLVNAAYQTRKVGTLLAETAHLGVYGVYAIELADGSRYRSEGRLQLPST